MEKEPRRNQRKKLQWKKSINSDRLCSSKLCSYLAIDKNGLSLTDRAIDLLMLIDLDG